MTSRVDQLFSDIWRRFPLYHFINAYLDNAAESRNKAHWTMVRDALTSTCPQLEADILVCIVNRLDRWKIKMK